MRSGISHCLLYQVHGHSNFLQRGVDYLQTRFRIGVRGLGSFGVNQEQTIDRKP